MSKRTTLAVLVFGLFALAQAFSQTPKFLTIGTANTGGAYYPIGIAMADLLTNKLNIKTTAQTTGGAVENNILVNTGKADLAITTGAMAFNAYSGQAPYKAKQENMLLMFSGLSKGVYHAIVNENSPIKTIKDLKGKKVVLGPPGGAAIPMTIDVLSAYGMTIKDIKPVYVAYDDGTDGMTSGNYDAVIVQSAVPAPAIYQLTAAKKPVRLIDLDEQGIKILLDKFPYYARMDIPKEAYSLPVGTATIYVANVVVVNKALSDDLVYNMTKLFFENVDRIVASHPSAKALSLQNAVKAMPIPLHPGAAKYFKEKGVQY
ncbi:MAG: TAXI family TRAP transporter solute-binding subunit [Treponemataceae bacterium]